jgi:hypothetical protein
MLKDQRKYLVQTQGIILRAVDVLHGIVADSLLFICDQVFQVTILELVTDKVTYYMVTVS